MCITALLFFKQTPIKQNKIQSLKLTKWPELDIITVLKNLTLENSYLMKKPQNEQQRIKIKHGSFWNELHCSTVYFVIYNTFKYIKISMELAGGSMYHSIWRYNNNMQK